MTIAAEGSGTATYLSLDAGSTSPVSAASEGRLRYNTLLQQLELSVNGGAYTVIATGLTPWTRVGTVVYPVVTTDTVAVGVATMSGSEQFRVTAGAFLVDGAVGPVPVSGAGIRMFFAQGKSGAFRAGEFTGAQADAANVGLHSFGSGLDVTASGAEAGALGKGTTASGDRALAIGENTQAPAAHSMSQGLYSRAPRMGQRSLATGRIARIGDAQGFDIEVFRQSVGAAAVELTLDGAAPAGVVLPASNRLILEDSGTYTVSFMVTARNTAASESKGWRMECIIKRDVGAGTVALVGVQSKNLIGSTAPGANPWDCNLLADPANGSLQVMGTGAAGKTINWSAYGRVAEVGV